MGIFQSNHAFRTVIVLFLLSLISPEALGREYRVKAGQAASIGQFPSVVYLETNWNKCRKESCMEAYTLCAGVIIDESIILTSAHCVCQWPLKIKVYTAVLDFYKVDRPSGEYNVVERIYHDSFSAHCDGSNPAHTNDIAIAKVDRPFQLSDHVKVAQMSTNKGIDQRVTVVGYGLDHAIKVGRRFGVLKFAPVKTADTCPDADTEYNGAICLNSDENLESVDKGDAGGPMFDENQDVIGIYSGRHHCKHVPTVFTVFASIRKNEWFITNALRAFCRQVEIKQVN
jgi:secreted trypsin-like serine protease